MKSTKPDLDVEGDLVYKFESFSITNDPFTNLMATASVADLMNTVHVRRQPLTSRGTADITNRFDLNGVKIYVSSWRHDSDYLRR